jgi:CRISPR-associated protein Csd1
MILQALQSYYERMRANPDSGMPPFGTSIENISFALVLDGGGELRGIDDLRELDGNKLRPRKLAVPAAVTRTSGVKANFGWDKAAYVLGNDKNGVKANADRFVAFKELFYSVCATIEDDGFLAVWRFLDRWNPEQAEQILSDSHGWEDLAAANLVFRLEGTKGYVHNRAPIQTAWLAHCAQFDDAPKVQCLITGDHDVPQARVHTPIKGVSGGQTSGGYIVSYNATAFISYGKDKADVGKTSAFAYTTALNALLARGSRQRITIGDSTIAFWAERTSPAEAFLADLFDPSTESTQPETNVDHQTAYKIHDLLQAIRAGKHAVDIVPDLDEAVRFYLLALAPNAARLSIRFWEVDTVGGLMQKIGRHFHDLEIIRQYDNEPEFPPLWLLLRQTATLNKSENISPILAGGLAKAMLTGAQYPQSLLPAVLGRIRAEHMVTYYRAALIKAFLTRNKQLEVPVSLDSARTDRPYLLGRLFAVLEKAQDEAVPGAGTTIKDRYLGSASANPGQIFNVLLKGSANHLAKLRKDPDKKGMAFHYDIMMQDIINAFRDFPTTMSAADQGLFMIGYYHQRKDFFTKKKKEN